MLTKDIQQKIKNTITVILVGSVLSFIPFYYETNARTKENGFVNKRQDEQLNTHEMEIQNGKINDAVEKVESEQIKASLKRIEAKLDRLIEKEIGLIN